MKDAVSGGEVHEVHEVARNAQVKLRRVVAKRYLPDHG
jgi:hypothetical protein